MKEKYKHLNDISKAIKLFNYRIKKEQPNLRRYQILKYINELELKDEVFDDVIQLIKSESGLNLKEFIRDINLTIKERNYFSPEKIIKCVKNKKELIQYMRNEYSNYVILSNPIDNLLYWTCTIKGYDFYAELNETIIKKLNNKL